MDNRSNYDQIMIKLWSNTSHESCDIVNIFRPSYASYAWYCLKHCNVDTFGHHLWTELTQSIDTPVAKEIEGRRWHICHTYLLYVTCVNMNLPCACSTSNLDKATERIGEENWKKKQWKHDKPAKFKRPLSCKWRWSCSCKANRRREQINENDK